MRMEEIAFPVRTTVFGVLKTLAVRASQSKLDLVFQMDPLISDYMIGDPFRLKQIITNLVGNAVKFTQHGAVALSCRFIEHEPVEDVSTLEFCVADTGIGIKPDKLNLIFDTFCQADGSTTRKYGGTGLGLTISKRLVTLMGGELWVESQYGVGSQFFFSKHPCLLLLDEPALKKVLPLAVKVKRAPCDPVVAKHRILQQHAGRRVLSIETQSTSAPVADAVAQLGLETVTVKSLDDAYSHHVASGIFDTVLIDQHSYVEKLRDIAHLRYTPLVLVASSLPELNLKSCLDFGIANVIQTPASVHDVANALTSALETSNRSVGESGGDVKFKILLAEDSQSPTYNENLQLTLTCLRFSDVVNQKVALRFLESTGHKVDVVENGALAIEAYKTRHYDVILMDVVSTCSSSFASPRKHADLALVYAFHGRHGEYRHHSAIRDR